MVRRLFLLLVIVGAFAVVFGVVLGVGVMRISPQAPAAIASGPSTLPVVTPAARPAAQIAAAAIGPAPISPAPSLRAPVRAERAALRDDPPAIAGTIILKPEDAVLKGNFLRLMPNGDLRFGARRGVSVVWEVLDVPAGEYHVDLTYAAADDGGGEVQVQVSQDGGDNFTVEIEPTGGDDKFRMVRRGTLHFTGKRKAGLIIRSRRVYDEDLMCLRRVELIPTGTAAARRDAR